MERKMIWQALAVVFCIVMSGFFSASETAFSALNHVRLKSDALNGDKRAKAVLRLSENYDKLLSTILIGNNIVNIVSASISTLLFTVWLGQYGVTVSTVVITAVILIFGEISPKSLAKENSESVAKFSAPLLNFFEWLLVPLNFLFSLWKKFLSKIFKKKDSSKLTQEDLMILVDEAQNEGGIDERNGELIRSAIEFNDLDANDIITPRVDIIAVDKSDSIQEIENVFQNYSFSRLPVYDGSIDKIIGMIHEKDFYRGLHRGITSCESILKKVIYIAPSIKISDLLRLLQQTNTHLAVVVDEFGGTAGIVSMEDILEQLVGDIWDENDQVIHYFQQVDQNTWLIAGRTNLDDMFEEFDLNKSEKEYESVTVSGWIMEQLGKIPSPGDSFVFENSTFTVTQIDKRHVLQVKMVFPPQKPQER